MSEENVGLYMGSLAERNNVIPGVQFFYRLYVQGHARRANVLIAQWLLIGG